MQTCTDYSLVSLRQSGYYIDMTLPLLISLILPSLFQPGSLKPFPSLNFDFGKISELALQDAAVQGAELTKHVSLLTSKYTQLITVTLPLAFVIDML